MDSEFFSHPSGFATMRIRPSSIRGSPAGPAAHAIPAAPAGQGAQLKGCSGEASALVKSQFSTSAPVWRQTSHGLCIEGVCRTPTCMAYNQMVIYRAGFTSLDIISTRACKCPCCQRTITPATAAFNNCEWKISGTKRDSPGAAVEEVQMDEWEVAGNCYERFKDDPDDKTIWTKLVITARPPSRTDGEEPVKKRARQNKPDPELVECSICCSEPLSRFGPTAINTPCGHCFHRECLKPWVLGGSTGCPTCERDISCLAKELQK